MMTYLLNATLRGEDIGHYGRLVVVMVGRHFLDREALVSAIAHGECDAPAARALIDQVELADYSPPKRAKILDYAKRQEFPLLPDASDPDAGNVYRTLQFPEHVYEHIGEYREAKASASG